MATLSELEQKYFVSGAGVPHSADTEVIPHVDGRAYFAAIQNAIDKTGTPDDVIYITSWLFSESLILDPLGPVSLRLSLHDKAVAGVDVRIIIWTGRFMMGAGMMDTDTYWDSATRFASGVESAGGFSQIVQRNIKTALSLRRFNPLGGPKPPLRDRVMMDHAGGKFGSRHQKYTVVYRKATSDLWAFVGGIDFDQSRFSDLHHTSGGLPWHDVGVELRKGAAASVWADFRTRWEEAKTLPSRTFVIGGVREIFNNPATLALAPVPPPPQLSVPSTSSVRVLRSYAPWRESPVFGDDLPWATVPPEGIQEVFAVYEKALNAATNYIYVEDQALNTEEGKLEHDMLFPLIAAAARRGVKVIFVVPGMSDPTDPGNVQNKEQSLSLINNLVFFIDVFHRDNFVMYRVFNTIVHSKVLIIDDEFFAIGSANFFDRSMEGRDTELQAAIVDPGTPARDLRVRLWADHLRVDPTDPLVAAELGDLTKSLGLFNPDWITGSGVTFAHPNSAFQQVE